MKLPCLATFVSLALGAAALVPYVVPPDSPGYQRGNSTQHIQFDTISLFIDGERIFLFGGEFHPWRLPVPDLWSEILQKMKAAGLNAVSIYWNWSLVEGKRGSRDWDDWRSIETFLQIARDVGIFVVCRPGPYINAEAGGGGLPGWLTNSPALARTNATDYMESWQGYISDFSQFVSNYQYPDGPVIAVQAENEFFEFPTGSDYMAKLELAFRTEGITNVPLIFNDAGADGNFVSGTPASVDIWGFDSYPNTPNFNCNNPLVWAETPTFYVAASETLNPWGSLYFPEFQGGVFDSWGGDGYASCFELLNSQFVSVFYKNNVASGSKAMSFYMLFGGTNWGNSGFPGVYTSYDYGAAISEGRVLTDKFNEIKLQGLFYHSSTSLYGTSIVGSGAQYTNNPAIFTTNLGATGLATNYYIVRQSSNSVLTTSTFTLTVNTTLGELTIPQLGGTIALAGRDSKTLVTEYVFGQSVLRYSTAEVMTQISLDGVDYIVLYVPSGEQVEALVTGPASATPIVTGAATIQATAGKDGVTITGTPSTSVVQWGSTVVIVVDKDTAKTFWNPRTILTYDQTPATPSVLVVGPYLVRNASIEESTLALVGDTNGTTSLTILAPAAVTSITWNGEPVSVSQSPLGIGLTGMLSIEPPMLSLPSLRTLEWQSEDSLPEAAVDFDDSEWTIANLTSTTRPQQPTGGTFILYADEYGYHAGSFIFRGYFNGTASGVRLDVQGGNSVGFTAFINGHFLGSGQNLSSDTASADLVFPSGAVTTGVNVLTVVSDCAGHDEDQGVNDQFKNPRGIRGYALLGGGDFNLWRLAGTLGGEDFPDKLRGPYNEGGFFVERTGAILPGFNYSTWDNSSPFTGISTAGIQAYHTSFTLAVPAGVDASLALQLSLNPASNYRTLLFVNGWQFGRFIANYGPQTLFPIPEGILNHQGDNDLVVTLWSLDPNGAQIADLELVAVNVVNSGKTPVTTMDAKGFKELR